MRTTSPHDISDRRTPLAWLYTALTGALICGILGPALPLLVMVLREISFTREAWATLYVFIMTWPIAVILMGPSGVSLGALGALYVRFRSRSSNAKRLFLEAVLLGTLLGATVPLIPLVFGSSDRDFLRHFVPTGAITGSVCALLVFCSLRKLGLLFASQAG